MPTTTKQRTTGENVEADKVYARLAAFSPVLNPSLRDTAGTALALGDLHGCEALLVELVGEKDGLYRDENGKPQTAGIPVAEARLEAMDAEFTGLQARAKREGRRCPTEMPPDMAARRVEQEARLGAARDEAAELKKRIAAFKAEEEKEAARRLLPRGPEGTGKLCPTADAPQGRLVLIDGQSVAPDPKTGELVIAEAKSPYHGVRVADYREFVVHPYLLERQRLYREQLEAWRRDHPNDPLPAKPPVPWPPAPKAKQAKAAR